MNRNAIFVWLLIFCVRGALANEEVELIEVSPLQHAIESLASDSFQEREAASKTIWEFGADAVAVLEQATLSPDPEVAYRARILWDRIRTGISPDTPTKIVELVQKYNQSGQHEKFRVLESLSRVGAYAQVLRLYHFEEDESARKKCLEIVNESVVPAVLMALAENDQEEGIALLRIAPPSDENYRRLAALYRDSDKIDEVLEGLKERADPSEAPLLLACLRAKGELEESIVIAEKLGRDDIVGGLELLNGNPIPYVQWKIDDQETSSLERLHMEIVLEHWSGDRNQADRLAKPMIDMAREGDEDNTSALRSILLNGYFQEAELIMKKNHEMLLFSYYEMMEEPWKALNLLGYARDAKEQEEWRARHLELLEKNWNFHSVESYSYFTVAEVLYQRGAVEEGLSLLRPVMHGARKAGGDHWDEFFDFLVSRGRVYMEMGFILLSEEILPETKEKEARGLLVSLTGRSESVNPIWIALGEKEGLDLKERFLSYAKVYGYIPGSVEELDELWSYLEECAEGVREPSVSYQLLLEPASYRGDAKLMVELLDILKDQDPNELYDVTLANYYSFHHRWEESEKVWASLMPDNGAGNRYLGFYAGVLWRLGKKEEAQVLLDKLTVKNLDDPLLLKRIALALESNGVWELSSHYWRQILLTTEPTSRHWIHAVEKLSRDAKVRKDWRLASALAMVQSAVAISGDSAENRPVLNLRKFFYMSFFKALDEMKNGEVELAENRLKSGFLILVGDGVLADDFFPILREEGHTKLHDYFFEQAYARFYQSIKDFPEAHNTLNGIAWLASRSSRRLDEAEEFVAKALELRPRQAAYLDTMAEVCFARQDREKALLWSNRSLRDSQYAGHSTEGGSELRAQHDRFLTGKFPVK